MTAKKRRPGGGKERTQQPEKQGCKRVNRFPGWRERRGAALLEFALVMPILLVVGMAMVQYAIIMKTTHELTNISREGARYAALNAVKDKPDYSATKSYIAQVADSCSIKADKLGTITIDTPNGVKIGEPVNVDVTYNMGQKLFLPANFFFISIYNQNYTARTSMIIQQGKPAGSNQVFPTPKPTNTPTPRPTSTPTNTPPPPTPTPFGYVPPTPIPTNTPVPTPTPTRTPFGYVPPTPVPTNTPGPTNTPKPTSPPQPTNTPAPTPTPTTRRPS